MNFRQNTPIVKRARFDMDADTLLPTHSGGLLDLSDDLAFRLMRGVAGDDPEMLRLTALEIVEAMAASEIPTDPLGAGARLVGLASAAFEMGDLSRYLSGREALRGEILLAGRRGLDADPAEATVLVAAAHLHHPDGFIALAVALGMLNVRRAAFRGFGRDVGERGTVAALREVLACGFTRM